MRTELYITLAMLVLNTRTFSSVSKMRFCSRHRKLRSLGIPAIHGGAKTFHFVSLKYVLDAS